MIPRQEGGWDKVQGNLATAKPGTRAWPNKSKDQSIGARLDFGELFLGKDGRRYRNIVLQPNKGAKDPNIAKMAKADSHQKLKTVAVPVDTPITAEQFESMLTESLG